MQRRPCVVFLFFALLPWLGAPPAAAQRLPDSVVPEHYTLWFAPDLEKATFRGRETIRVQMKAPARTIVLHAAELAFADVTITAGDRRQAATVTLDPDRRVHRPAPGPPSEMRSLVIGSRTTRGA